MSAGACDFGTLMPVEQAIDRLLANAPAPPAIRRIALDQAMGRVLAVDVRAPINLPIWDNSAMDGYAFRISDVPYQGSLLRITGRIAAGDWADTPLLAGEAMQIFTGAPLPVGADTVMPQELCRVENDRVWIPSATAGQHVRRKGEEVAQGALLLEAGKRLRAQELGLLAGIGMAEVDVYRPLRVCLLSSGNELREPGESLLPGQIYNSNRHCLAALLRSWGAEVLDYGVMADELADSQHALSLAASECDVLLSSGGVSVGEEDHLKQAIEALGRLDLWRLAIQPGKPLAFGEVAGKPWLGLPGNPAAALITALVVVRPFLLRAQGVADVLPKPVSMPAGFDWLKPHKRRQYLRARITPNANGQACVELHPQQGSAMLSAACWADGLAVIDCEQQVNRHGSVEFLSFAELMQ